MAGRGSRYHAALNRRQWALARLKCFEAAGWRCERCGRAGRLEAHHKQHLEHGGAPYALDNLECLCRGCHIDHHRSENETPGRAAWRSLIDEMTRTASS